MLLRAPCPAAPAPAPPSISVPNPRAPPTVGGVEARAGPGPPIGDGADPHRRGTAAAAACGASSPESGALPRDGGVVAEERWGGGDRRRERRRSRPAAEYFFGQWKISFFLLSRPRGVVVWWKRWIDLVGLALAGPPVQKMDGSVRATVRALACLLACARWATPRGFDGEADGWDRQGG